jgi:transcriptional regulator with XRE-family HTH domain
LITHTSWSIVRVVAGRKKTRLRLARDAAGVSQQELAELAGIPIATYRRLERGEVRNPSIRLLVNCAIVLFTPVEELLDDEWLEWLPIDRRDPPPVKERRPLVRALPPRELEPEWTKDARPAREAYRKGVAEYKRQQQEKEKTRDATRETMRRRRSG